MARGRMISKSLGTSRKFHDLHGIGRLAEFAQVLFVLLVAHSDDFGRQSGDAFTVKHAVFPTSPRSESDFEAALDALARVGLVQRYGDDARYIQINDFDAHQAGLHKRSQSRFPDPPEIPGNSRKPPEIPSELEPNLTEPKRTKNMSKPAMESADFDCFWAAYPRKVAKDAAKKAWARLAPGTEIIAAMLTALEWQRKSPDWCKQEGLFIPHPASWLNNRRWEDEPVANGNSTLDAVRQGIADAERYEEELKKHERRTAAG